MKVDEYDNEERVEERKKYNFYNKRSEMTVFEVISMAQFRLSLYSIFNISDDMEMSNLKTKKVRNQVRIVKDQSDKDHDTLKQV